MNVFMLKQNNSEDYFVSCRRGKIKWNKQRLGKIWNTRSGPIKMIRDYELKGTVNIAEFELTRINEDPK